MGGRTGESSVRGVSADDAPQSPPQIDIHGGRILEEDEMLANGFWKVQCKDHSSWRHVQFGDCERCEKDGKTCEIVTVVVTSDGGIKIKACRRCQRRKKRCSLCGGPGSRTRFYRTDKATAHNLYADPVTRDPTPSLASPTSDRSTPSLKDVEWIAPEKGIILPRIVNVSGRGHKDTAPRSNTRRLARSRQSQGTDVVRKGRRQGAGGGIAPQNRSSEEEEAEGEDQENADGDQEEDMGDCAEEEANPEEEEEEEDMIERPCDDSTTVDAEGGSRPVSSETRLNNLQGRKILFAKVAYGLPIPHPDNKDLARFPRLKRFAGPARRSVRTHVHRFPATPRGSDKESTPSRRHKAKKRRTEAHELKDVFTHGRNEGLNMDWQDDNGTEDPFAGGCHEEGLGEGADLSSTPEDSPEIPRRASRQCRRLSIISDPLDLELEDDDLDSTMRGVSSPFLSRSLIKDLTASRSASPRSLASPDGRRSRDDYRPEQSEPQHKRATPCSNRDLQSFESNFDRHSDPAGTPEDSPNTSAPSFTLFDKANALTALRQTCQLSEMLLKFWSPVLAQHQKTA